MKIDTLIVGQGLAGSLLAWQLLDRGQRVLVVDRDEQITSSKVAAGLVTPIAGSRFNVPAELGERLLFAKQFYWEKEEATSAQFFHHKRIARLFRSGKEAAAWDKRLESDGDALKPYHEPLRIEEAAFHAPHSGFEMKEGGWLDVPAFLEATRQHLLERASYAIASLNSADVIVGKEAGPDGSVRWKNIVADRIIFAEGWKGNQNRFFDWLPMKPAAGDILHLEIPELEEETRIVNGGGWLLPLGNGLFRAGSTYRHEFDTEGPTAEGRREVLEKLGNITPHEGRIIKHEAAVRPIIRRSQIFMGQHPSHEEVILFNGLGSKGVLNGPWHSSRLVEHLLDGRPLPESSDLRGNLL